MIKRLQSTVVATLGPLFARPRRKQVAALCLRRKGCRTEVLMITSRGTGRWILPKGWPINGLSDANAALQEAWEEAGVKNATLTPRPVGQYRAVKTHPKGVPEPVDTLVFACEVGSTANKWPESDERTRRWMRPEEAAHLVKEPGLRRLLRAASLL